MYSWSLLDIPFSVRGFLRQLESIFELENARIGYTQEDLLFHEGIDLTVEKGEHAVLVGPCSIGKSAIVKTIMGLLTLWGGSYMAFGRDMKTPSLPLLSYVRRKIGILPDRGILLEHLTVFENIALPSRFGTFHSLEKIFTSLEPLIGDFNLDEIMNEYPSSLSIDQIKKVGIVRAVLNKPDLLILDDPFEGLDDNGVHMLNLTLERVNAAGESTIVIFSRKSREWPLFFKNRYLISPDGVKDIA